MVGIPFLQNIHNSFRTVVGVTANPAQKLLREPTPSGIAFPTELTNLRIIQTITVGRFNLALQDGAILEYGIPKNNVFGHSRIGIGQLIDLEDFAKIIV